MHWRPSDCIPCQVHVINRHTHQDKKNCLKDTCLTWSTPRRYAMWLRSRRVPLCRVSYARILLTSKSLKTHQDTVIPAQRDERRAAAAPAPAGASR